MRRALPRATGRPLLATLAQAAWLLLGILILAPIAYVLSFDAFPAVVDAIGPELVVVLAPLAYVAGVIVYGLPETFSPAVRLRVRPENAA